MAEEETDRFWYGDRFAATQEIVELEALAERILTDLPRMRNAEIVPSDADFGIHLIANVLIHLNVGGLSDDYLFDDRVSGRYSRSATTLVAYLNTFLESYNRISLDRSIDRRFFSAVYLFEESEYRGAFWTPGVSRLL